MPGLDHSHLHRRNGAFKKRDLINDPLGSVNSVLNGITGGSDSDDPDGNAVDLNPCILAGTSPRLPNRKRTWMHIRIPVDRYDNAWNGRAGG